MFVFASKFFAVVLAAVAISKSYVDFRAKAESLQMFLFWVVTWTGIVIIAVFPFFIDILISTFGGGRAGLGTFFGMALVFLFFILYRMYVKMERLEQNLTKIVRELALRDHWTAKRK